MLTPLLSPDAMKCQSDTCKDKYGFRLQVGQNLFLKYNQDYTFFRAYFIVSGAHAVRVTDFFVQLFDYGFLSLMLMTPDF